MYELQIRSVAKYYISICDDQCSLHQSNRTVTFLFSHLPPPLSLYFRLLDVFIKIDPYKQNIYRQCLRKIWNNGACVCISVYIIYVQRAYMFINCVVRKTEQRIQTKMLKCSYEVHLEYYPFCIHTLMHSNVIHIYHHHHEICGVMCTI